VNGAHDEWPTRPNHRSTDPYQLLGVPRSATNADIRRAYEREVARATRAGATAHATDLSRAFDTLSSDSARALYDRHGVHPAGRRSSFPPATRPSRSRRSFPRAQSILPARSSRRPWRQPVPSWAAWLVAALLGALATLAVVTATMPR